MNVRSLILGSCAFAMTVALLSSSSFAVVTYFDGFGDGDRNNDGILDALDADWNDNGTLGDMITPAEFPLSPWTEISAAENPSDTGIRWLHSRGWSGSVGDEGRDPKANIRIINDAAGALPDSTHPTYPVASLDTGYALGYDSKGRGSSITGFFGENVALGAEVGDQVKVSFDFRIWLSNSAGNDQTPPRVAALRFGLFQDTDNQIGMTNNFAGVDPVTGALAPAIWGTEGGHFRGDIGPVGAVEDRGWYTNVDLGRTDWAGDASFSAVDFDGTGARINEETNTFTSGGKFLEGSDNDFVAKTDELDPTFTALDVTRRYNLALTLERATAVSEGDTIKAIYTVIDKESGMTWTIEGTEGFGGTDPDQDGAQSDNWDYFGLRTTTPLTSISPNGDDYDFIMDNFMLETITAGDIGPDFSGDGNVDCVDVDGLVATIVAGTNDLTYDITGDTLVNNADLDEWLVQAGAVLNANGNPILAGDADLDGNVNGSDFLIWNNNKFTTTAAWCDGDFNADGNVNGGDFLIWNTNKFQSSDVSAVPEPASSFLILVGVALWGYRRK